VNAPIAIAISKRGQGMALEIERKFLIARIPTGTEACLHITQAYLHASPGSSVRLRITSQGHTPPVAELGIKGPSEKGHFTRSEFQYAIPLEDARAMLAFCQHPPITKLRYHYRFAGKRWEIDQFLDANEGLLLAEIELEHEQQTVELPPDIIREVTGDPRYFNMALADHPYTTWKPDERTIR